MSVVERELYSVLRTELPQVRHPITESYISSILLRFSWNSGFIPGFRYLLQLTETIYDLF